MNLQEWANANKPKEDLIYKEGYWDQIIFVRDNVLGVLSRNYEEFVAIRDSAEVISSHRSKSVCLPVFQFKITDGTIFTMRCNFYNWIISVNSPNDVNVDFMDLFNPTQQLLHVYCEGFPKELVYGPYSENKQKFTIEISAGDYYIFTFFWLFAHKTHIKEETMALEEENNILKKRISKALDIADNRWSEWGDRALAVVEVLEGEVNDSSGSIS